MRLFTAIEIPAEVKDNLRALLQRIRPLANFNWSPVENLHITTKFIGEWPEARLPEIKQALAAVAFPGIDIAIQDLGWFPNPRQPRIFWAGVHAGEALNALAAATDRATAAIGVPVETRPYSPHLTLARLKDRQPLDRLRDAIASAPSNNFGLFKAESFFLYLSAGGKYTKLAAFPSYTEAALRSSLGEARAKS
jgi:2'-5' RNA ligase